VQEHRLRRKPERDRLTCDWLAARCDAMCLKLAVIKGQLLKDTYSHQAVVALRKIKSVNIIKRHKCKHAI
jgi:HAUS augmin-like complex subunit 4